MAAPADPVIPQLQSSLKANLVALSHILSFHNSLSQLNASEFAPRAPKAMRRKLTDEAQAFDALCDQVEQRVLRAMAVLDRDSRKAAGEPLLTGDEAAPAPADAPPAEVGAAADAMDVTAPEAGDGSADPLAFAFSLDALGSSQAPDAAGLQSLALDLALPQEGDPAAGGIADLDLSFLSDPSLFPPVAEPAAAADAAAAPAAGTAADPTTTAAAEATSQGPSLFPAPAATSAAPMPAISSAPSDIPDLDSLLSMVNSYSAPDAGPGTTVTADAGASGASAGGLDLSAAGLGDLFGGTGDLGAGTGTVDGGTLSGMDFDMSGMDFSGLDMNLAGGELNLDELLKGFNPGGDGSSAT